MCSERAPERRSGPMSSLVIAPYIGNEIAGRPSQYGIDNLSVATGRFSQSSSRPRWGWPSSPRLLRSRSVRRREPGRPRLVQRRAAAAVGGHAGRAAAESNTGLPRARPNPRRARQSGRSSRRATRRRCTCELTPSSTAQTGWARRSPITRTNSISSPRSTTIRTGLSFTHLTLYVEQSGAPARRDPGRQERQYDRTSARTSPHRPSAAPSPAATDRATATRTTATARPRGS